MEYPIDDCDKCKPFRKGRLLTHSNYPIYICDGIAIKLIQYDAIQPSHVLEYAAMESLSSCPYSIRLLPESHISSNHMTLVMPLCSMNLRQLVAQGLPLRLVKKYALQIVIALLACESRHILHYDVKPENILYHNQNVFLADYGLCALEACDKTDADKQSLYVRSPEMILRDPNRSHAMDMWSFGCVLYFMLTGKFHMMPSNEQEAIQSMWSKYGGNGYDTNHLPRAHQFVFHSGCTWVPHFERRFRKRHPKLEAAIVDLLSQLLDVNPMSRISVRNCYMHSFFDDVRPSVSPRGIHVSTSNERKEISVPIVESLLPRVQLFCRKPKSYQHQFLFFKCLEFLLLDPSLNPKDVIRFVWNITGLATTSSFYIPNLVAHIFDETLFQSASKEKNALSVVDITRIMNGLIANKELALHVANAIGVS